MRQFAAFLFNRDVPVAIIQLAIMVLGCSAFQNILHGAALTFAEFFAGVKAYSGNMWKRGFRGVALDILIDGIWHDILSPQGFAFAILIALCVTPGGMTLLAPVCSSWVWICCAKSLRSVAFPMGDEGREFVRLANIMVSRVVAILWILTKRGIWWLLEQPLTSLLVLHDRFQEFVKHNNVWRAFFYMGLFFEHSCDTSAKPSVLYSNKPIVGEVRQASLQRAWPLSWGRSMCNTNGTAVTGNSDALKDSAAYPMKFGQLLADLFVRHKHVLASDAIVESKKDANVVFVSDLLQDLSGTCCWHDAEIDSALEWLCQRQT